MYSIRETFVSYISYIHSWLTLFFLLVFAVRISLLLFFFPRGARGHAVVMVNDPFSDLPFFGSEESVWSEITNPFLDSPKKTHYMFVFFAGVGWTSGLNMNNSSAINNGTQDFPSECHYLSSSPVPQWIKKVVYLLILLLALFWNASVMWIVYKQRRMHKATNYLIVNMAVSWTI